MGNIISSTGAAGEGAMPDHETQLELSAGKQAEVLMLDLEP